jgi:hypothetical protein
MYPPPHMTHISSSSYQHVDMRRLIPAKVPIPQGKYAERESERAREKEGGGGGGERESINTKATRGGHHHQTTRYPTGLLLLLFLLLRLSDAPIITP